MTDWRRALVSPEDPIRTALNAIDQSGLQIALVVSDGQLLEGVVTDGDIRRGLLEGLSLDSPVAEVMNESPTTADWREDRDHLLSVMRHRRLHQIPLLNDQGKLMGLEVIDDLLGPADRKNWAVLMAGGLGTRLRPLTRDVPKPLVEVGGKPILEISLERLLDHGFRQFYISVNYKAEMIEDYFGGGSEWDAEITYLREDEKLGTAGSLSLLPEGAEDPLLVMNGDILTTLNFTHLMQYHGRHETAATMCVRDHDMQVPYGVIRTDKHRIVDITEKPIQRFFVNAGIYVLDSATLPYVDGGERLDMPEFFQRLQEIGESTAVFPLREYWTDIGRSEDLETANERYNELFG